MMDLEGSHAYCMFISIGLLRDDECGFAQYDDECECAQMRVFMRRMTLWGSANLTLLHISLTKGSRGCASALGIHTRTCESCVGKYYTSNLFERSPL